MQLISKEINGKLYEAEYIVNDNMITVYGSNGEKTTQINGMKEISLARILLSNLIQENKVEPTKKT